MAVTSGASGGRIQMCSWSIENCPCELKILFSAQLYIHIFIHYNWGDNAIILHKNTEANVTLRRC